MKKLILTLLLASFCGLGTSSILANDGENNGGGGSGQETTCSEKSEETTSQS